MPDYIDGRLGYYSFDAGVPITAGTWDAVQASADVALSGARTILDGATAAFSLCRPPGHHAASSAMGGYCYLNNAAIAAQYLVDQGRARVAILDVDYHHGNGTQEIFYERADVLFVSLHADPRVEYPYFLGHADERGAGAGLGFTRNYPLPFGTAWPTYATGARRRLPRDRRRSVPTRSWSRSASTPSSTIRSHSSACAPTTSRRSGARLARCACRPCS